MWFSAAENIQRIRDAGVEDSVFPVNADARSLPFEADFFDAILCIDSICYFGTEDLYLNNLARFVKPGGQLGIAGAGLIQEIDGSVPDHLHDWWTHDLWCLHSAAWWKRHWKRTGILDIELADTMPDGWQVWLEWQRVVAPENKVEIKALEADRGVCLGYVRAAESFIPASVRIALYIRCGLGLHDRNVTVKTSSRPPHRMPFPSRHGPSQGRSWTQGGIYLPRQN